MLADNIDPMEISAFSTTLNEKLKELCPELSNKELNEAFEMATKWPEFSFDFNSNPQVVILGDLRK